MERKSPQRTLAFISSKLQSKITFFIKNIKSFIYSRAKKAITIQEYLQFLETIAKNKKVDLEEIKNKLTTTGPPSTTKTTVSLSV